MDIIDYLITHIGALGWSVKGPGLILIAFFLFRAAGLAITLRLIKSATSVAYAAIIALGLARFGPDIEIYLQDKVPETVEEPAQN